MKIIEKTKNTPKITIDEQILEIEGESAPENSLEFYKPVFDWLNENIKEKKDIEIRFFFHYFNTSTSKCLIDILDIINDFYKKDGKIDFIWKYHEYDEDMLETIKEFLETIEFPSRIEKI